MRVKKGVGWMGPLEVILSSHFLKAKLTSKLDSAEFYVSPGQMFHNLSGLFQYWTTFSMIFFSYFLVLRLVRISLLYFSAGSLIPIHVWNGLFKLHAAPVWTFWWTQTYFILSFRQNDAKPFIVNKCPQVLWNFIHSDSFFRVFLYRWDLEKELLQSGVVFLSARDHQCHVKPWFSSMCMPSYCLCFWSRGWVTWRETCVT